MSEWRDIKKDPPPRGTGMIIWARPKGNGEWSLGLAYMTVSGYYSDAYESTGPLRATHWKEIGEPPSSRSQLQQARAG